MDSEQLIERINAAEFSEFRIGSPLINDVIDSQKGESTPDKKRVTHALVMRHHWLQNKQAPSTAALRHAIKSIEGIYLGTLWELLFCESKDEREAAEYIIGEIGGVGAFMNILTLLRGQEEATYPTLLPCLTHTIARYYAIRHEEEPTGQVADTETGEIRTISLKDSEPDLYEKAIIERKSMNEFFHAPDTEGINDMVGYLHAIDSQHFTKSTKEELINAIKGLAGAS